MTDFSKTLGRLTGVAHHLMQKQLDKALKEANVPLTAEQFKMMNRLWEQDGISQQELAIKVGRNRAASGRMIDTLERKGLIERHNHPTDRRLKLIFLSKKGKQIKTTSNECAQRVLRMATQSITSEQETQLKELLMKMINNLK